MITNVEAKEIRQDFPIFAKYPNLVYLDNAATTQKPQVVIDSLVAFYCESNANAHRGVYQLSRKATLAYDNSRSVVASFIGADVEEVIFIKGATQGFNALSRVLASVCRGKDIVV